MLLTVGCIQQLRSQSFVAMESSSHKEHNSSTSRDPRLVIQTAILFNFRMFDFDKQGLHQFEITTQCYRVTSKMVLIRGEGPQKAAQQ